MYVARLRSKLEDSDGPPLFITEPRSGYRFTTDGGRRELSPAGRGGAGGRTEAFEAAAGECPVRFGLVAAGQPMALKAVAAGALSLQPGCAGARTDGFDGGGRRALATLARPKPPCCSARNMD